MAGAKPSAEEKAAALLARAGELAETFFDFLMAGAEAAKIPLSPADINPHTLIETAVHFLKDMDRISEHQGNEIAPQNWVGFLVFWISKLKPIQSTTAPDANERVALHGAHLLLAALPLGEGVDIPDVRDIKLSTPQAKGMRISRAVDFYMRTNGNTLLYSVRHRNLTGDALSLLYGAILKMAAFWEDPKAVGED